MNTKIIADARRFLGIKEYPGNLFDLFQDTEKIIENKKIILFKSDIDKLSGFIGYSNEYTIICINNNRNIGHQNFTLAHELGHKFLHIGISKADKNPERSNNDIQEREANNFAKELLYPRLCVQEDIKKVLEEDLLREENWEELANYIDNLSCKYYTSFKFTFNRLLEYHFESYNDKNKFYEKFKENEIGKFDNRFPDTAFMHNVKRNHNFYKSCNEPYKYMKKLVAKLIKEHQLGTETGEAMIERYRELEG